MPTIASAEKFAKRKVQRTKKEKQRKRTTTDPMAPVSIKREQDRDWQHCETRGETTTTDRGKEVIRKREGSQGMAKCCVSFTAVQNSWFRYSFARSGLKSTITDLGDGTVMHCWVPKAHIPSKPTLVLIHGFGANAMWQFNHFIPLFASKFNVYVPDLLFFGESYTSRPERTEAFQAQCVMGLMETHMKAHGFPRVDLFGLSYGGFVAYRMAAQYRERVGRVVLGCAGVCVEEKDMEDGMLPVKSVEEAVSILLPQTVEKARQLVRVSFHKPPPTMPSCCLRDFIQVE